MNTIPHNTIKAMKIRGQCNELLLDATNYAAYIDAVLGDKISAKDKMILHTFADAITCKAYELGVKNIKKDKEYSEPLFIQENQCFKQVAKGLQEVMDKFRLHSKNREYEIVMGSGDMLILLSAIQFPLIKAATTSETPTQQAVDEMKETLKVILGL